MGKLWREGRGFPIRPLGGLGGEVGGGRRKLKLKGTQTHLPPQTSLYHTHLEDSYANPQGSQPSQQFITHWGLESITSSPMRIGSRLPEMGEGGQLAHCGNVSPRLDNEERGFKRATKPTVLMGPC